MGQVGWIERSAEKADALSRRRRWQTFDVTGRAFAASCWGNAGVVCQKTEQRVSLGLG
jgi:hypothetical protein